jgi:hypothetical protein
VHFEPFGLKKCSANDIILIKTQSLKLHVLFLSTTTLKLKENNFSRYMSQSSLIFSFDPLILEG